MNLIDDVKMKLTDAEYKALCDGVLKSYKQQEDHTDFILNQRKDMNKELLIEMTHVLNENLDAWWVKNKVKYINGSNLQ